MNLKVAPNTRQSERWPRSGRHILDQFDPESVIVYQAYRPSIGRFAAAKRLSELRTPAEDVYPVVDPAVSRSLGLDVLA